MKNKGLLIYRECITRGELGRTTGNNILEIKCKDKDSPVIPTIIYYGINS